MKYPIILFKNNDKTMGSKNDPYCSPNGLDFFKNCIVIDSDGYEYEIMRAKKCSGINFFQSLRMFTPIIKFEFEMKGEKGKITIEHLKLRIINHVERNKFFWGSLGTFFEIQYLVNEVCTFEDLIKIFR